MKTQFQHSLDNFSGGSMTTISDARLGKKSSYLKFAEKSVNLVQEEDGVWTPRPGTSYYNKAVTGAGIWYAAEYTKTKTTREIIAISSNGKGYKSTNDGATWTEVTGMTWTTADGYVSTQFKNQLWISNGVDVLSYYDGTVFKTWSAISNPTVAPAIVLGAGLSAGSYKYYVRYTANNDIGWTSPSPAVEVAVNKPRDQWKIEDNDYVTFTVTAVTSATSYDMWLGNVSGDEYHLGSMPDLVFRDVGTPVNSFREIHDDATTTAPKVGSMELSGNRLWATKDPNNPYRLYGTGTGQYLGYFSPFYGGFWIDLERGGEYFPTAVVHYRTGKGDPMATVLCASANGDGQTFQVDLTTISVGDITITVPVAYKLVGSRGTNAAGSVVKFGDNIAFLNHKGAFFLRNKEQLYNVLATDDMTAPFRNEFAKLNHSKLDKAVAHFSPPRLLFSVPSGEENDTTFYWDDERRNWVWAWDIGFKHFFEHVDSAGVSHLLGIRKDDTRLIEITSTVLSDLGQNMYCQYVSPLIPIDAGDHRVQAKINESIFEVGDVQGVVSCTTLARTKKADIAALKTKTITASTNLATSGIGDDLASDMLASDTESMSSFFAGQSRKKSIKIKKKVYALKYRVSSIGTANAWKLYSIQSNGSYVLKKSPGSWRRD